jgi:hypothetical protein
MQICMRDLTKIYFKFKDQEHPEELGDLLGQPSSKRRLRVART